MSGNAPAKAPVVGRWVIGSAIAGTILIGLGAFWLSFTALADLARRAGTPPQLAWVWPLIVDGVIVIATISVVALSHHGHGAARYPWVLLTGAALVSVSANIAHAVVAADDVAPLMAGLIASVPPIVLLAITHLTVELTRYQHPARAGHATVDHHSALRRSAATMVADDPARGDTTATVATRDRPHETASPATSPGVEPGEHRSSPATRSAVSTRDDRADTALALHHQGLSNRQIATRLEVHPSTIGRWLTRTRTEQSETGGPANDTQIAEGEHE